MSKKQKSESIMDLFKRLGWIGIMFFAIIGVSIFFLLLEIGKWLFN